MKLKFKLRPAFSATVFCLSAISLWMVAGCNGTVEPEGEEFARAEELPAGPFSGSIVLIGENATRLHVGDSLAIAQEAFPKPKRSFSITTVPPEFEEKYQVYGWENPNRSFAVLTQNGATALALDIHEKVDDAFIAGMVESSVTTYGEPTKTISAGGIKYWFWEDGLSRAMICVAVDGQDRRTASQAIGYVGLMDYLRMGPDTAQEDAEKSLKMITSNGKS